MKFQIQEGVVTVNFILETSRCSDKVTLSGKPENSISIFIRVISIKMNGKKFVYISPIQTKPVGLVIIG